MHLAPHHGGGAGAHAERALMLLARKHLPLASILSPTGRGDERKGRGT